MSPLAGPLFAAAVVLAAAGALKVLAPGSTRVAMRTAGLPAGTAVARLVGVAEVVVALSVVAVGGALPALALTGYYLAFAAFAERLRRRSRGRADCGCFGGSSAPVSRLHVVVNLVIAAASALTLLDPVPHALDAARSTPWSGLPFAALVALLAWQIVAVLTVLPEVQAVARGVGLPRSAASARAGRAARAAVEGL